jgi:hypothetical protein
MGSKRSTERMERLKARLYEGMTANGISPEVCDDIYLKLAAFANYGFPVLSPSDRCRGPWSVRVQSGHGWWQHLVDWPLSLVWRTSSLTPSTARSPLC